MARPRKLLQARTAAGADIDAVVALLLADDPTKDDDAELRKLLRANLKLSDVIAEVGGYVRISEFRVERDADGSIGVLRQGRAILRRANERGVKVVRWYCDNDFSAARRDVKRPGFLQLLADIEAHQVNGLLAWDSYRLLRQQRDLQPIIDLHESRPKADKPYIATCDGTIDLSTPQGVFMATQMAGMGQMESAMSSKRIKDKKASRFEDGWWQGGTVPYGYRRPDAQSGQRPEPGRLELEPAEADVVREMAKLVLDHVQANNYKGWNLSRVCRHLNAAGYQPRRGDCWRTQTIRAMLLNPLYAGYRTYQPCKPLSSEPDGDPMQVKTDKWPAILTDDEMLRLRAILTAEGRRTTGPHGGAVRTYLGSGILRCGACGGKNVRGKPGGKDGHGRPMAPRYQCIDNMCCSRDAGNVDRWLQAFVVEAARGEPDLLADAMNTDNHGSVDSGKAEVLARLAVVQTELKKDPAAVVQECGLTFQTYASLRRGLEAEEQALLASLVPAGRPRAVLPPAAEVEALVADPANLAVIHEYLSTYLEAYSLEIVMHRVGRGSHNRRNAAGLTDEERRALLGLEVRRAVDTQVTTAA